MNLKYEVTPAPIMFDVDWPENEVQKLVLQAQRYLHFELMHGGNPMNAWRWFAEYAQSYNLRRGLTNKAARKRAKIIWRMVCRIECEQSSQNMAAMFNGLKLFVKNNDWAGFRWWQKIVGRHLGADLVSFSAMKSWVF